MAFVRLTAPDARHSVVLLSQPEEVLALTFSQTRPARSDRFSGPLIRSIASIGVNRPTTLAAAR
jgi:hypothetical protein